MAHRPLIVIAEDEPDTASLVAYRLQKSGVESVATPDGVSALNAVFEHKPDLVILDLMMPRMDGLEVCRLLKTSPITRKIPVLLLTALASPTDKLKGFGSGADDYLTKPFEMSELVARVFALLRRAGRTEVPVS
jgi:two-component system response regulator RpaA